MLSISHYICYAQQIHKVFIVMLKKRNIILTIISRILGSINGEVHSWKKLVKKIAGGRIKVKRKFGIYVSIVVLTLAFIGANQVFAEKGPEEEPTLMEMGLDKEEFHHKRHKMNPEIIKKRAEELGIETEGKETEVLAREIHEAKILEKAKELGIKTEGKKIEEIAKEIRELHILNKAKELGISTDGKQIEDIAYEIRETLIMKKAKELKIDTEGKSLDDLSKEIFEVSVINAAKELGIKTDGKDIKEIAREVIDKKTMQTAEKLGIDVKNKSTQEILEDIFTNYKDEAIKQKLFPFDDDIRELRFMGHKEGRHKGKHSHE